MINQVNREKKKAGISLSELLVVLSVALVLAAILTPAIAGQDPERAETILSSADTLVVFDGIVQSSRSGTRDASSSRRAERIASEELEESRVGAVDESDTTPAAATGISQLLTTDIRQRQR